MPKGMPLIEEYCELVVGGAGTLSISIGGYTTLGLFISEAMDCILNELSACFMRVWIF